jgi:hypothetical protein
MTIPTQVQQLIDGSGNTFHAKVARWFHSDGWHIVISPYYMDQSQNKAREIDLIAEKAWPIRDSFGRHHGDILVRLFIECKFVPSHSVFWFAEKDTVAANALVCSSGNFDTNNMYTEKHHYLAQGRKVAKLFASVSAKGQEVEPFYKALNQVLNAQVSMRGQSPNIPSLAKQRRGKLVLIEYPIVACSSFDQLYAVDFYGEGNAEPIRDNFQLEVQYAYVDKQGSHRNDYFLLDLVEFRKLTELSVAISKDAEASAYLSAPG